MLTADPEGFPLGLAELGLKKPKAGGENVRGAAGAGPSPARGPRLGLADLPREGNEGLGWPEGRRGNTAQRAAPEGPRPGPCCGQTLTNGCGGGWVPTVSRGSEGADQRDSTSRLRSNGPDVTVMPGLILAFASGGQQGRDTENTVSH